jgi:glycosyltransferase involved in cell wall biosynthesis
MHVCYLMPPIERYSPISGGALSTCAMQQTRHLLQRGYEVSVLSDVVEEPYQVGRLYPVRVERRDTLNKVQRLVSRVRRTAHRWDWLYYEYYLASVRQTLRKLASKPDAVIMFNDLQTPQFVRQELPEAKVIVRLSNEVRTQQRDFRPISAAVDTFVTVSSYVRDWTQRTYNVSQSQIRVIPNGADPVTFHPREGYLEPTEPVRVLFIGRLNHDKGPDIAADAVAELQKEGLPVALTVAGAVWWYGNENQNQDPFVQEMMRKMERTQAQYLGHVNRHEVPALIRSHDIVCVLSRWNEPMSQTVFEAMASGCALLSSNRGGLPEGCGDGAILVDPYDFPTVVEHLRRLVLHPDQLREAKERARRRAQQSTWGMNVDALETVLRDGKGRA